MSLQEKDALMQELESAGGVGTNDLEGLKLAHDLTGEGKKLVIGIGVGEGINAVAGVYPHHYQDADYRNLSKMLLKTLTQVMLDPNAPQDIVIVITDGEGAAGTKDFVRVMEGGVK